MTHDIEPVAEDAATSEEIPPEHLVPGWLAALVLVLLLAVVGLGGFLARGLLSEPRYASPEEREVRVRETELASDPDDIQARLALGYAYQQAGRLEEALAEYAAVLELVPTDTAALYNTGVIRRELGEDAEAEAVLWEVLEVNPEHVLAAKALGELYADRAHYRSLVEAVRPAAEANPSSADLQYLMGLAYENLGRIDWAAERYRLALTYYPDMPEAREGLERLGVEQ